MAIDHLDSVRVLTKKETLQATGLSEDTWDRLKERGETPPKRSCPSVVSVIAWLT